MFKTLEVSVPPAAAEPAADLGIGGDDVGATARRAPAGERLVKYGRQDCPYGWVCVAEQHAHDLGPLALIDVYSLPEDGGKD
jgi:hypothetical protein